MSTLRPSRRSYFHPYPKYLQISDLLRRRVLTELGVGERLPTEVELSRAYGVSRETLRQALQPLAEEGLITRTRGLGSVVAARPSEAGKPKLTGMTEDLVALGLRTSTKTLRQDIQAADPEAAHYLNLPPSQQVVRIDRLRYFEGAELSLHSAFLPIDVGAKVLQRDLDHTSIVIILRKHLGYALEEDQQIVEADAADVTLAEALHVRIGAPILLVRRLYITRGERPIAYFKSWFNADRYHYTVKLRQPGIKARSSTQTKKQPRRKPPASREGA